MAAQVGRSSSTVLALLYMYSNSKNLPSSLI
jgi:hypothetical protein